MLNRICVSIFLAWSLTSAGWAQEDAAEPNPEDIFFDTTEINVVNVEVFVTDKRGRRVTGLQKDDFEVLENGKPMTITNFYAVEDGRPTTPLKPDPQPATGEPERLTRLDLAPVPALPAEQRLHLIIYVDNFNIRPANRNRVLRRLRGFLRQKLDRGDRVMVVSYDRSLHLRQPFTADFDLVSQALIDLEELSGIAVNRDAERRKALENIEESSDSFEAMQFARSYAEQVYTEMDFVLDALEDQLSALSGLVGRKAVLHVSDGLPMIAGEDLFIAVDERFRRTSARLETYAFNYTNRFRELIAKANAAGVTFYTLDAGGMQAHSSISAEYGGSRQGGGLAFVDAVRSANLQAPLHLLADDTGGAAFVNTNAVEASLENMVDDFRNYYSLGYQPGHRGDGRYYSIDVRVKRKGLVARHRKGYRDRTPEARLTDGSIAALYFGFETNPLAAGLEFGDVSPREGGHFLLPLKVKIPLGNLTLAPHQDSYHGRFKVSVVVMDAEGRVSPVRQQEPVAIDIPSQDIERARLSFYAYEVGLAVRKGIVRIAVGVRDEFSTEISFLNETLSIGG